MADRDEKRAKLAGYTREQLVTMVIGYQDEMVRVDQVLEGSRAAIRYVGTPGNPFKELQLRLKATRDFLQYSSTDPLVWLRREFIRQAEDEIWEFVRARMIPEAELQRIDAQNKTSDWLQDQLNGVSLSQRGIEVFECSLLLHDGRFRP